MVVGSVDASGKRMGYSQGVGDDLDSSAVGDVVCPSNEGKGLQGLFGTSFGMT